LELLLVGQMRELIEHVLADNETRERLLDYSVLSDFFFEEKLKERRIRMLQEQKEALKRRKIDSKAYADFDTSVSKEVLTSLQHLPEVIRPEHIRLLTS